MLTSNDSGTSGGGQAHVAAGRRPGWWRQRRSWVWWVPEVLVVALLVAAVFVNHYDLGRRLGVAPDPTSEPAEVAAPAGLALPAVADPVAVAAAQTGESALATKVTAALGQVAADPRLGPHVRVLVTGLDDGKVLLDSGSGVVTPASTMKILTSVASLASLGPSTRFDTTVVRVPGTKKIVLVGGGDPFLASKPVGKDTYPQRANVVTLAKQTAQALAESGTRRVRLSYDDSAFTGPAFNPAWPASYAPGVVPPITALWVDEGKAASGAYSSEPSLYAAQVFRAALEKQGITVLDQPNRTKAPSGAQQVASVSSPTVGEIVSRLLLVSDNNAAEVMAHHVGGKESGDASFAGGAAGVRKVLTSLGVPLDGAVIDDGSGLARSDKLDPRTLMAALRVAASDEHPTLRQVITGLPVAGFSGSLENRFDKGDPAGRGRVQAKTGTLTGVHGLAGVATDVDGDVLGFVAVADQVADPDEDYAQGTLDRIAAALAGCDCR